MLGSLILYLKGMRIVMFQLSGFYCTLCFTPQGSPSVSSAKSESARWPSMKTMSGCESVIERRSGFL